MVRGHRTRVWYKIAVVTPRGGETPGQVYRRAFEEMLEFVRENPIKMARLVVRECGFEDAGAGSLDVESQGAVRWTLAWDRGV